VWGALANTTDLLNSLRNSRRCPEHAGSTSGLCRNHLHQICEFLSILSILILTPSQNVHDIAHEAIENARFVCEEHYALFKGPPVQLICPPDLHFPYVPGHLSHILFELLKNSLRAVVERYGPESEGSLPPIKVIVIEGHEDITIKISDEGGGIPRSNVPLAWGYLFTTMEGQNLDQDFHASDFKAPMAGFGYGLPLSRLVSFLVWMECVDVN
jgi:pyruvate dehydrogenase kinase 2/3/4